MKQFATLLATLLFLASTAQAQDRYYYSDERKIPIEQSEKWKVIQIPESAQSALISALSRRPDARLRRTLDSERGFYWLESKGQQALSTAALDQFSQQVPIQRIIPAFFRTRDGDTTHFVMTDEFRVQFDSTVTRAEINALNARYDVEILLEDEDEQDRRQAREYNVYLLRVTEASEHNALEAANLYYESPLTVWSLPNFLVNYKLQGARESTRKPVASQVPSSANDPLYDEQYYLNNTGQFGGEAGTDINAPEAWSITKGSSSIIVAVIDDGVGPHEDFYNGQLVTGYTGGGGDGSPASTSAHGQTVAGIIAANHNSIGVRGVAPNVKIMPIKIFEPLVFDDEIADAIDYAWQNGADVLNNSWGGGGYDDGIAAAITRARQNGRNGKGSVVVAAAGNTANDANGYNGFVTFPATVPGVLAVGSVTKENDPANYTPKYDSEVDIVAPSSRYVPAPPSGDVVTMDRMGSDGYNSTNYEDNFGGTSAAAPQASGVAALLLSEDPSLEEHEVRNIIRHTADDYGITGWDGEGRLNAYVAVIYQSQLSVQVSGSTSLHTGEVGTWTATVSNGTALFTYKWYHRTWSGSSWTLQRTHTTTSRQDSYSRTMGNSGFYIKVEVTGDAGQTASSVPHMVVYDVSGGDDCPPWDPCECPPGQICEAFADSVAAHAALAREVLPEEFALEGNYPNPFSGQTTIRFALPEAVHIELVIYDLMGRKVATLVDESMKAGFHEVPFEAQGLSSGVYLYRFRAGDTFADTGRMVIVR